MRLWGGSDPKPTEGSERMHYTVFYAHSNVNKCCASVQVWRVFGSTCPACAHTHSYTIFYIFVCTQFVHMTGMMSLQDIEALFEFKLLPDAFRSCFPWCLEQWRKCGSPGFGVRWFVPWWGERIGDSKWDHCKSPREGDRAWSHCLVCFLLLEVSRSEGITSLWSHCPVMKSSWKQLRLLQEHLAVEQTAVFPSPWGGYKKPSKWPLQKRFALTSPFPCITYSLYILLFPHLCHCTPLPASCFGSAKAFLGKAAHWDGGSLQQLGCFVIIPHVDTFCAC